MAVKSSPFARTTPKQERAAIGKLNAKRGKTGKKKKGTPKKKKTLTWRQKYVRYLKSDKWRKKKEVLFRVRGRKCEECGYTLHLHVHHLNYKRMGDEYLSDLQILCEMCHLKKHPHMK